MPNKDLQRIHEILTRGTVEVLVKADLEKKLLSGKKLRVKFGIDPSGADLHIGHMVPIKKLKQFQELGHHIILLFGNFTGQIGDPTGKSETRTIKTQAELEANARHYLNQVSTLLDIKNIEVVWNADWLKKLNFADVVHLSAKFTVAQMMERDMFQDRVKKDQPISVHEFLYPLMQGYDSVALKADVEIGGTDQTFNLLAGRTLQKAYGQTPQDIITVPILEGTDGKMKMGKSTNNYIGVNDEPKDMFGKIMSIPDELIVKYFELATEIEDKELSDINSRLKNGENPRDIKMLLAMEIIKIYHDTKSANKAKEEFINVFSQKNLPTDIPTKKLDQCELNIVDLCLLSGLVDSKGEARRLISQGGVKLDEEKIETQDMIVSIKKNKILQVGKRKFINLHC
ncbi:tyrosine--tRNA ligase [Candidatus Peregrinibacteria bacterium]|nr:tyrosine--tRNA ligase [Candidatus Peregrinibacteria bacterium]